MLPDRASKAPVRIIFEGAYDSDGDEFVAKTWFAIPRQVDGVPMSECRSSDKREFGFLHLRALRTEVARFRWSGDHYQM